MTGNRLHTRLFCSNAMALAILAAVAGLAFSWEGPPVWDEWIVPAETINGCRDVWVIDARSAPSCGDLATGMSRLRYYHSEYSHVLRRWTEYSQSQFLSAADASLPTTYYFHGYGLGRSGAIFSAERLADYIGADAPPFRLVIWIWPGQHRLLASPQRNVAEKTAASNAQGYYVATLVRQMQPDSAVTLAGHSFGSRCVLSALQAMAVGRVSGVPLPPDFATGRRIQATLMAPAAPSTALAGSGEYFLATQQAERMLITVNEDDVSLNLLARVTDDENVLGLTGPYDLPADANVYLLDTNPYLGRHHRVAYFAWSGPVATSLQPFLINYEAAAP